MIPSEGHYPVLIVGAGPSGLMMAAQLLRNGVQPLIIDSKKGPTNQSRALAVQARSMEIYRQMGLADKVLMQGASALEVKLHENQQETAFLSLKNIGEGMSMFPYIQIYEQSKNERLLLDFLTQNCCRVYWNTSLRSLTETANCKEVLLADENAEVKLTCDWLIGADGAHSLVRKGLQIPFNGDTYQQKFYLADLQLESGLDENQVNLFLGDASFNAFFPMNGKGRFRLIGRLPQQLKEDADFEEVLAYLQKQLPFSLKVTSCNWFATYNLHHRMASHFATKKCFLIGDAAHVHSPVGGQGMNTGLQDAYNLAWKLAGVIKNQLRPEILLSYAEERMPVAKTLLKTTDRAFTILISNNFMIKAVRKLLIKYLTNVLWKKPRFRSFFFKMVSQIGISYRNSKINLNLSKAENIKAGDRLPFIKIFDEKKQQETDLHEWCQKLGFTFIALGKLKENDLFNLARWITQNYPQLNFFYLPFSAKNKAVFDCFEMKEDQRKAVIVRPDMYIGYLNDTIHVDLIDDYLEQVISYIKPGKK